MVTGGNVTGITDQLEKEGLVVRGLRPQRPPRLYREADARGPLGVREDGGSPRAMGRRPVRGIERRRKGKQTYRLLAKLKLGLQRPGLVSPNDKGEEKRNGR